MWGSQSNITLLLDGPSNLNPRGLAICLSAMQPGPGAQAPRRPGGKSTSVLRARRSDQLCLQLAWPACRTQQQERATLAARHLGDAVARDLGWEGHRRANSKPAPNHSSGWCLVVSYAGAQLNLQLTPVVPAPSHN
jgi:hypothetical protein